MKVESLLKDMFGKKHALVVERGNDAISIALESLKFYTEKRVLLISDQGGWISYPKLAKEHGFKIRKLKTNRGVIILEELEKSLNHIAGFLFTGFAGYYAEQPVDEIVKICKDKGVFVINDISGCFSSDLCKGDFLVASFGKAKVVNYGKYGFVCSDFDLVGESVEYDDGLFDYLKKASERLEKLMKLAEKVKEDLKDFDIFHRDLRGINVIVEYNDKVIEYCKKKGYEYVLCPKDFKVKEKAISIELKRLK